MNGITIRKATEADMETLLRFEQGVIAAETPFDCTLKTGPTYFYNIPEMIAAPHIELLVAETDQQLIASGYARIENAKHYVQHTHHAYLGFMYVVPEYRGKGINKKIIEALQQWSLSKNITEFRLDVLEGNLPAIKAYEKIGFAKHLIEMRMGLEKK